ncbi:MAG: hypothetical protein K0R25_1258 [Rickettsiaceae bacterium]|nr:hypothetical protein [Rickettsiaceae bacterium]
MKEGTRKTTLSIALMCSVFMLIMTACNGSKKEELANDCSSVFETTYVDPSGQNLRSAKNKTTEDETEVARQDTKVPSYCKVLELKIDKNITCQIVGSDKIDNLSKILSENKNDKVVLVAPEKKVRDLAQLAQKHMVAQGVNVQKYFDSDLFKSLKFPYKGMKCVSPDVDFSIWTGGKKVIITVGK